MNRRKLDELIDELMRRTGAGAKLGLERVAVALERLDDPQDAFPVVHVAGTNGKGSTCAMVAEIARCAGVRAGLYTSPHLCRFQERIQIGGELIDDALFTEALERALDDAMPPLSFFEVLTVAALWAMREAAVELAVLEVGLGGRLDATNVVERPVATAITSIALDHARFLGNTLASVAGEKAGIIKRDAPLVLGALPGEALEAIAEVVRAVRPAPLWTLDSTGNRAETISLRSGRVELPGGAAAALRPSLAGAHQLHNAALAAALCWFALPDRGRWQSSVECGLAAVRWPGRLERIAHGAASVLLDCAHNDEGAAWLARALTEQEILTGQDCDRTVLLFGALDDKPWASMLATLGSMARERVYCEPLAELAGRGSVPAEVLAGELPGMCAASVDEALRLALSRARPGDTVLVAGSIFLVGKVRALLLDERADVLVPL